MKILVSIKLASRILCLITLIIFSSINLYAGPQHWGFGMSYLAALETESGNNRLVIYEGPLRAKDQAWISRWRDRSATYNNVLSGGMAVGNFWPSTFSKEYIALLSQSGSNLQIRVLAPPEQFGTMAWSITSTATISNYTLIQAAAGDVNNTNKDQLLLLTQSGSNYNIIVYTAPSTSTGTTWTFSKTLSVPSFTGTMIGFAVGDFFNENKDTIAIVTVEGGATKIRYYSVTSSTMTLLTTDAATDLPVPQVRGVCAADYVKDDFDVLTLIPASAPTTFQLRSAPEKLTANTPNLGLYYNYKATSGQWLPGTAESVSRITMNGSFQSQSNTTVSALSAGRLFGYVNTSSLGTQYAYNASRDAEISYTYRTPLKNVSTYGWPNLGDNLNYEINLKNNGSDTIPAGTATLKVWLNTPYRNADSHPATCDSPTYTIPVSSDITAFTPLTPNYFKTTVTTQWPYNLAFTGPSATWKRVDVAPVGERWMVVQLECSGDTNLRNNRYEVALAAPTFHPIYRSYNSIADRNPTVLGDPCSKEYLSRKLADAVLCMYERSGTYANEDVYQRPYFDGYEIGWPDDLSEPDRSTRWNWLQARWEGWRELDGWYGVNQLWERFNWSDGGAELHETCHLFHPVGDLYQYFVNPVWTGLAKMGDGTPVQISTYCWGPDSYSGGEAVIGPAALEIMKNAYLGVRNNNFNSWWELKPNQVYVRVLDRDGNPISGATVKVYEYKTSSVSKTATTDATGKVSLTSLMSYSYTDVYGLKHYSGALTSDANIITVSIGTYHDAFIWNSEDIYAHGRYTTMLNSFVNPTGWTLDVKTNYKPSVPAPTFTFEGAVKGSTVQLGVTGTSGATYRLYRRWEPAYRLEKIGDYTATGTILTITQDMSLADTRRSARFRAIYEITEVNGSVESLPKRVQIVGISNAYGLTTQSNGQLILATNSGIANPFAILMNGVTPYQEYFYHFRFGHTARKVIQSRLNTAKYYATLSASDMTPDYRFDLISPSTSGYDVRNDITDTYVKAFTTVSPYTIKFNNTTEAAKFAPGDYIDGPSGNAYVTALSGDTITVSGLIVSAVGQYVGGSRTAGRVGSDATLRMLSNARGLAAIVNSSKEYIVIADTGNKRIAVWDDTTKYVTHYTFTDSNAKPAAIAPHPSVTNKFFALDRRTTGTSYLYLYTFNGTTLSVDSGFPIAVSCGDNATVVEIGLAAAVDPVTSEVVVAISDAASKKVLEYRYSFNSWHLTGIYDKATGIYSGTEALVKPIDIAFNASGGQLKLYCLDNKERVVLLAKQTPPAPGTFGSITGPVNESTGTYNHIGTDGTSLFVVYSNNQFWKYDFVSDNPFYGVWTQLATPTRVVNTSTTSSDMAYQDGYLYTVTMSSDASSRTVSRYNISANTWEVLQDGGGADLPVYASNGLFMNPSLAGVGYGAYPSNAKWTSFDWLAKTTNVNWLDPMVNLSLQSILDPGWVSKNEDVANNSGSAVYYGVKNDKTAGLTNGDILFNWIGTSSPKANKVIQKPWLAGIGQSIEFIPAYLSPSQHDEIWMTRGLDGSTNPSEGLGNATSDWARLDLTNLTGGWITGNLPSTSAHNGEILLVNGSVFARGTLAYWYISKLNSLSVGTLSGTVTLSDCFRSSVGIPVTVLFRQGGITVRTDTVLLGAGGSYTVKNIIAGTYDVAIQGTHWLRSSVGSITITANGTASANATLANGDTNGDNVIDDFDLNEVNGNFGSIVEPGLSGDVTEDGVIDDFDLNIINGSFGALGDL